MRIESVLLTILLAGPAAAQAQAVAQAVSVPDIESAYWNCIDLDAGHQARGQRMDESLLSTCSAISKRLQLERFGDDFAQLHAWTNAEKVRRSARDVPASRGPE